MDGEDVGEGERVGGSRGRGREERGGGGGGGGGGGEGRHGGSEDSPVQRTVNGNV